MTHKFNMNGNFLFVSDSGFFIDKSTEVEVSPIMPPSMYNVQQVLYVNKLICI